MKTTTYPAEDLQALVREADHWGPDEYESYSEHHELPVESWGISFSDGLELRIRMDDKAWSGCYDWLDCQIWDESRIISYDGDLLGAVNELVRLMGEGDDLGQARPRSGKRNKG